MLPWGWACKSPRVSCRFFANDTSRYRADTLTWEAIPQQHSTQESRVAVFIGQCHGAHVIELCFLSLRRDSEVHRQHGKQALNTKKPLTAFTQWSSTDCKRFQNDAGTAVPSCQSQPKLATAGRTYQLLSAGQCPGQSF